MPRILFSQLAFAEARDARIGGMRGLGFFGMECCLQRIAPWDSIRQSDVSDYRAWLSDMGLEAPAVQSVFYGSGVSDFSDVHGCSEHLRRVVSLSSNLGSRILVLGCPKMRVQGSEQSLAATLKSVDPVLGDHGMTLCIEPNCRSYGGSYFFGLVDIVEFISRNRLANVRTMIDTHNLESEGFSPSLEYFRHFGMVCHVHISAFGLSPVRWESGHADLAQACRGDCFLTYELGACEDPQSRLEEFSRHIKSEVQCCPR